MCVEGGVEWSLARYARIVLSKIVLSKVQHVLFGTSRHLIGQLAPRHAEPRLIVQVEYKDVLVSIALCGARLPSSGERQAMWGYSLLRIRVRRDAPGSAVAGAA